MKNDILYIKAEQSVEVLNKKIFLEDVVKLYSSDKKMVSVLQKVVLMFVKSQKDCKFNFSILKVVELINKEYPQVQIVNMGESDFVVCYKAPKKSQKVLEYLKTTFVATIIFFGAAFTIMTFNEDVGVGKVFDNIYKLVVGQAKTGGSVLEISYSIGLPIGIIVFFNHFSRIKIHDDPTPIQIQMRVYEEDVNKTLIQNANREGKIIDSD